jgi:hypothetical protein
MAEKGKNGGRNYKKEYQDYHGKPEQVANRSQRNQARAEAEKAGKVAKGDGKEVDHVKPVRKGGGNEGNTRVIDAEKNRGWRKGKKGYD